MSRAKLLHVEDIEPIRRGTKAETVPLVRAEHGSSAMINGISTFQPGTAIPLHTHNCDEIVVMLEGKGACEIDGETFKVKPYDTTFVAAGVPHCFWNEGEGQMRILWTYASTSVTRTIVATGETFGHLSEGDRSAVESRS